MGIRYTRQKEEDNKENVVQAEEFVRRMVSLRRAPEQYPDIPNTEIEK